jgi:hypothetical protein
LRAASSAAQQIKASRTVFAIVPASQVKLGNNRPMPTIEADYLVIGAGAMGMAFADTMVAETDASLVIVDRYHQPGGHWTTAYPYVRLHQPSAFYGVNSRKLGSDTIDRVGWNEGLFELATAGEVCAYFDQVMQQQLLPTGRVSYFPMSEYQGDGRFRTLAGEDYTVKARRRVVDSAYMRVVVPSMRPPAYDVAAAIDCVPPNDLPKFRKPRDRYVIVGAGKTGMDACLWLLRQGIAPDKLTWIMPRDSWLLDRAGIQPGPQFADPIRAGIATQLLAINAATSIDDLFERLADGGRLLRLDPAVRPTMYRCATVSQAELDQLRTIKDVVRLGHVQRIEDDKIVLDRGTIPAKPSTLYIDCTADGLERRAPLAVFDGNSMTLQTVRGCQQVFSAAFIAHVEAAYHDDAVKNELCAPVPHPDSDLDWLGNTLAYNRNLLRWLDDPDLMAWLDGARLDMLGHLRPPMPADPQAREKVVQPIRSRLSAANAKLEILLSGSNLAAPR